MIRFNCETCKTVINVPDEYAGRKVKCAQCQAILLVPQNRANFDSLFGEIRYASQDMVEMRFRQLFQALLQQEQQAPPCADDQLVTAGPAATNE